MESARVFGEYYGTRKKVIEEGVARGRTLILTVDIQGARSIRRKLRKRVSLVSIFILPPSVTDLRDRLRKRSTESAEEIERRIERAQEEIKIAGEYDHTLINRNLDQTIHELEALVEGFERKVTKWERR